MKEMHAKYKGYCGTCHYTIWKNEIMNYDTNKKTANHLDCVKALKDPTPRIVNPSYLTIQGQVDKEKLINALQQRNKTRKKKHAPRYGRPTPERGHVRFVS